VSHELGSSKPVQRRKTPSVAGVRSDKPEPGLWPVQPYICIPERCAHPRPCRQTSAPAPNGYWVWDPRPSLTDQTHTTPQLRLYYNALTAKKLSTCREGVIVRPAPVDFCHSACIRLAAAPFRPLFLTDLGAAPSPLAPRPDPHDYMAEITWWQELQNTIQSMIKGPYHCLVPRLRPTPSKQQHVLVRGDHKVRLLNGQ
jgi:hypothetical protein